MGGMPSARGLEWRTDGTSRRKFTTGFDAIPKNPDGTMRVEPDYVPIEQPINPPECKACGFVESCDPSCSNGSQECRKKLGI